MSKKEGFTRLQHERVGFELQAMDKRLSTLLCCVNQKYTLTNMRKVIAAFHKTRKALTKLSDELDTVFWEQGHMDFGSPYHDTHMKYCPAAGVEIHLTQEELKDSPEDTQ